MNRWIGPNLLLTLCAALVLATPSLGVRGQGTSPTIPKALCGPHDRTESVQGETTLAERFAPGPSKAYSCNLDLVGQFEGEGAGFISQTFEPCVYYATWPYPGVQHPGVAVVDVSDVRHPRAVSYLNSPAMRDANESLAVSETGKLLLASPFLTATPQTTLEIYDISKDCRHPVLKSSSLPGLYLHTGQFAPDGQTFYGAKGSSDPKAPVSGAFVVDTHDSSHPRLLATWVPPKDNWATHAVRLSPDGARAYVALLRYPDDPEKSSLVNGLLILDVSDFQARRPNPQFRLISTLFWDDTHYAQFPIPITIQGRSYVVFTDLVGAIGTQSPPPLNACSSGKPGWGFARIIDISDEKHPQTVSKLMLEVHSAARCSGVMHDGAALFGYGSTTCDVDDHESARLLACGYFEGGLRVFDIRDALHPKEVAYYKPPARRMQNRRGSLLRSPGATTDLTADQVIVPKFLKSSEEIGFISLDNGFQVVRFTDRFRELHPQLFAQPPR